MTQAEVHEFEEKTKLVVMSTANIFGKFIEDGKTLDGRAGIEVGDIFSFFLNFFSYQLHVFVSVYVCFCIFHYFLKF